MGLFRRTPRPGRAGAPRVTWAEQRAAARTARADAKLAQTEERIHALADEVRRDLRGTRRR